MDADEKFRVFAHTQALARQFNAYKGTIESLITYVNYSLGEHALPPEILENFIRREENQRELQAYWEVGLWRGSDKLFRLVSLAITSDPEVARRRLTHIPASPRTQCCFCEIDEGRLADFDLKSETDLKGNAVPARFLHDNCKRAWGQLRAMAEQADKIREGLL